MAEATASPEWNERLTLPVMLPKSGDDSALKATNKKITVKARQSCLHGDRSAYLSTTEAVRTVGTYR